MQLISFCSTTLLQVILATNIAESSVTIPKVGYVIDSCRSLQVFWDHNRKTDCAELVWVSKSQVTSEPHTHTYFILLVLFLISNVSLPRQTNDKGGLGVRVMVLCID